MYYRNSRLYLDFYSIYSVTAIVYSRKADALPSYSFLKRGNDDKPGIQIKYVTVLAISSVFREEFSSLLELTALTKERLLIVGDFNLGIRETPDDAALRLLDIADTFGLSQLVAAATHESGSILDLVFARMSDDIVRTTNVLGFFSDHRSVLVSLSCRAPRFPTKQISFRRLHTIDPDAFAADFDRLSLITDPSDNLDEFVRQYNDDLRSLIDNHAPFVTKTVVLRPSAPWISETTRLTSERRGTLNENGGSTDSTSILKFTETDADVTTTFSPRSALTTFRQK